MGHAMPLFLHWLHLVAAVAWIGGVTFLTLIFFPIFGGVDPLTRAQFAPRLIRRFLVLVWSAVLLLLLTGLYRIVVVQQMVTTATWLQSSYGHILMTKLALYLLLVGIVVHFSGVSYPRIREHMREHLVTPVPTACTTCARLLRKTRRMMLIAWTLGLLALLLAARLRGA